MLDEWIAEVGEAEVASTVRATVRAIEDGLLPGHTDAASLLQVLEQQAAPVGATWRVITSDAAWSDIERLTEADWAEVADGPAAWVEAGPPRSQRRIAGGLELFEDEVAPGCRATYLVNDIEAYVAVVRVRTIRR